MATTFRAVVMLAALVGLPGAWIYYGPLPTQAQRVVDRFVAAAKETIGWNEPSAYLIHDSKDVNTMPPAPMWNGAAGIAPTVEAPPLVTPQAQAPSLAERVEPLLARLRQLGAIEYALEPWGDGRKLFRFHCAMPLGAGEALTQQFEAVAGDPQESVEQVVAQISQWRRSGM